jgi:hypothetical protein
LKPGLPRRYALPYGKNGKNGEVDTIILWIRLPTAL